MRTLTVWTLLLLVLGAASTVSAQEAEGVQLRTLLIQDGKIFIDGRPIPASQAPGVSISAIQDGYLQVSWMGEEAPLLPLNGHWFRIEKDRLVPQAEVEAPMRREFAPQPEIVGEPLRSALGRESAAGLYLRQMREENRALFGQLSSEGRMEWEARQLAFRIRASRSANERETLKGDLKTKLEEILELKHENRLAEIRELEERLSALKQALKEREKRRGELVDVRLQELIGEQ